MNLRDWLRRLGVVPPELPDICQQSGHMVTEADLLPDGKTLYHTGEDCGPERGCPPGPHSWRERHCPRCGATVRFLGGVGGYWPPALPRHR